MLESQRPELYLEAATATATIKDFLNKKYYTYGLELHISFQIRVYTPK